MNWSRFFRLAAFSFLIVAPDWADAAAPRQLRRRMPHLEKPSDPYLPPGPRQVTPPGQRQVHLPPGTFQVNVDENGFNILGDAGNEPSLAVDPINPNRIVVGWRQFDNLVSNFRKAGWAYSSDAGQSWTFPGSLETVFRSDPIICADAFGNFYYNSLRQTFCVDVFKSGDGGATWPTKRLISGGDKAWMEVDRRSSGTGAGHLYCAWSLAATCGGTATFTRSTNGGLTWSTPQGIPNNPTFGTLAVGPGGELYAAGVNFPSFNNSTFVVARSDTARSPSIATTWNVSVTGNLLGGAVTGGYPNPGGLLGQVWIAVNFAPPPMLGHVYLCSSVDPSGTDPMDVRFSRSVNQGQTWSPSIRINDDPPDNGAHQWFATMSVAPNGRIDVIWNDTRDDPLNHMTRLYYAFSYDEGVTWSTNFPLTPAWNPSLGYPNQAKIGDYYDMESDNLGAHLAFSATFNGEEDVYYMRILANDCNRNGVLDHVEIDDLLASDCDSDGLPDDCQVDCDYDGVPDVCELPPLGLGLDCNANGVPDECEPGHEDCDASGTLDQCEGFVNCNGNTRSDFCDITLGTSQDCNSDNMPDECQLPSVALAADFCLDAPYIDRNIPYPVQTYPITVNEGSATCNASGRDVYFRYRPVADGLLTVSLCANTYMDTIVSLHTGCPGTTSNQITGRCDDNGCGFIDGASLMTDVPVAAGTDYLIRVAGVVHANGGDAGYFTLQLDGPAGFGDCDQDGTLDDCEIAAGGDVNGNGMPDTCDPLPPCNSCPGDMDASGTLDGKDIQQFAACLLAPLPAPQGCGCADADESQQLNFADAGAFVDRLLAGVCE